MNEPEGWSEVSQRFARARVAQGLVTEFLRLRKVRFWSVGKSSCLRSGSEKGLDTMPACLQVGNIVLKIFPTLTKIFPTTYL